jgi:hypothetical protein
MTMVELPKLCSINSGSSTEVVETFEAESENPVEMQKVVGKAILNNFKAYVEK